MWSVVPSAGLVDRQVRQDFHLHLFICKCKVFTLHFPVSSFLCLRCNLWIFHEDTTKIKLNCWVFSTSSTKYFASLTINSPPQRWLNALQDHCAYSTHYTTMPHVVLLDELDEDYLPLGSMEDALKVLYLLLYHVMIWKTKEEDQKGRC